MKTPRTDEKEAELELNESKELLRAISNDIERIANDAMLPDGDFVTMSVVTWADEWNKRLKEIK